VDNPNLINFIVAKGEINPRKHMYQDDKDQKGRD
jgi:hypothetical protein